LDVHPWITLPGCFVYSVTAAFMTGLAKIQIADFAEINKANILGVLLHLLDNDVCLTHELYGITIDTFVKG
jgi:hypothetical protein